MDDALERLAKTSTNKIRNACTALAHNFDLQFADTNNEGSNANEHLFLHAVQINQQLQYTFHTFSLILPVYSFPFCIVRRHLEINTEYMQIYYISGEFY